MDPTIRGLVLTSYDDEQALTTAVLAGASGFLLKDVRGNGLVDAIRRIAAGRTCSTPSRRTGSSRHGACTETTTPGYAC